ncbi:MAG: hypothetical protein U0R68_05965 [Candidatus Nanopelagicales bacterium]
MLDYFASGGLAAEGDSWGPSAIVDSWLEPGSEVIRIVYRRWETDAPVIGYRCDVALQRDGYLIPSKEITSDVIDQISEPLGRQADLLVEEQGVSWWGDGYPGLDQHPDTPAVEAYMEALIEHQLRGGPKPAYPFIDRVEAEYGSISDFTVEADDSAESLDR